MTESTLSLNQFSLFVGIDWADAKHDCHLLHKDGSQSAMEFNQTPQEINEWVNTITEMAGDGKIAIMLEQSKGALIYALMQYEHLVLYPINPKQLARYRESYPGGNGKSDPTDAMYLARMLRERIDVLRPWVPNDQQTRMLTLLCEGRRKVVDSRTKLRQQLIANLKQYFPLILQLFGDKHQQPIMLKILKRWSDPRELKRADRRTIRRVLNTCGFRNEQQQNAILDEIRSMTLLTKDDALIVPLAMTATHLAHQLEHCQTTVGEFDSKIREVFGSSSDFELFSKLRGAGAIIAPRLLCAFGSDRDRWKDAAEIEVMSGIAPITRASGKRQIVTRRYARPRFLHQTFIEFAEAAKRWCPWTNARYRMLKDRGMKHYAALRKLARSWIRILYKVWKTRTPFDCDRYIENLKQRLPEIIPYLEKP